MRKQLYWNTLLRIPVQAIVFVVSIIVTRILDPKDFGIMAVVMMLVGYSNLLTNFGFNEAVVQKAIRDNKTLNSIFTINLILSIILASVFFMASEYISVYFSTPEVKSVIEIMSLVFIITSFYSLPQAMLRRDMMFKKVSIFDAGKSLAMAFLTLILALNHFGYWSLVYGQLIPLSITTLALCVGVGWMPKLYFNSDKIKGVMHFGAWNFVKSQLQFIVANLDRFIIGRWIDVVNLGYYDKAVTLSRTPYESITMNINSVMYSSFSACRDDPEILRRQFKKSLALIAYINFPIYLGLIAIAPYFVESLLGLKWSPMIDPFQIILTGYLATSFSGILSSLIVGIGKYKEQTILLFISTLIFLVCCFMLLDYGISGIAISFLIFSLIHVILWARLAKRQIRMSWGDVIYPVLPGAASSVVMFSIISVISLTLLEAHTVANMIYLIITGFITYVICLQLDRSELAMSFKKNLYMDVTKLLSSMRQPRD